MALARPVDWKTPKIIAVYPSKGGFKAHRMQGTSDVWIGLGANLGDCTDALRCALHTVHALPTTRVLKVSSLYRSAPIESTGPDYLNAVAHIATKLAPKNLLEALQSTEWAAGRERPYQNAPRTLDLDILWWGDEHTHLHAITPAPALIVPHPRMYERAFVLFPLAELAPQRVSLAALQAVQHQCIERIHAPDWATGGMGGLFLENINQIGL